MAFRRGPNISQFLRELHENPTLVDSDPAFSMDDQDLSMFTNTEFFDLETGQSTDFHPPPPSASKLVVAESLPSSAGSTAAVSPPVVEDEGMTGISEFGRLDFIAPGDFNFPGFDAAYSAPAIPSTYRDNLSHHQTRPPQSIQPTPQPLFPANSPASQQLQPRHNGYEYAPAAQAPPRIAAAEKRASESLNLQARALSFEEQTRIAAEEDKRRRNTAASARFRIKKKQREQALEKSAKEMTDKVTALEGRIQQLETENKWLKSIVLEKNAGDEAFLGKLLEDFKAKNPNAVKRIEEDPASQSDEEVLTRDSSG